MAKEIHRGTLRTLIFAALLALVAGSSQAGLDSVGKLNLEPYDPDKQLPEASKEIAEGACNANLVISNALANNSDAAREQLGGVIQQYGAAAGRLQSLRESSAFDGMKLDPSTPGLDTMQHLFDSPPEEVKDILLAMEQRAVAAKDAATRIQNREERPDDLMGLMRASSELSMLLTLLGEALVVST